MTAVFTPSLFDDPGLGVGRPGDVSWSGAHRTVLDERSWVDVVPGWLPGAEEWFSRLVREVPWLQRRRRMFDQEIVEPRLTCGWDLAGAPAPADELAPQLTGRYGEAFDRVSANFYRDGTDSVAWHGDRVRFTHPSPVVAIVSLGAPRRFGLRPVGPAGAAGRSGGGTRWLTVCGGDLLVMGGRCQHEWQHTVPKDPGAGPRISVTFRHSDPGPVAARSERAREVPAWALR
ncbi:alpha-ketoglutarate-dependent dioxygenase AlkB [Actinomycetospora corticicola]|uniref:Alkylated DNA repair dioxygenase AlkB n=1 Tax=Actinomycetospora corticicola TaxID=663602 RepID=A0A7Y9DTQ1_9PSEU|nr:alpha-ketoglutarate-dependent dioxygenase AlkB [Actinomycetospora corticicola]NYD34997.1 alkylated DNA repair dioxygenase AlkB [Actinomycetospora corticicola]